MEYISPTFATGYARNAAQSLYPDLWTDLFAYYAPSMGLQGKTLLDFVGNLGPAPFTVISPSASPTVSWVAGNKNGGYGVNIGSGALTNGDMMGFCPTATVAIPTSAGGSVILNNTRGYTFGFWANVLSMGASLQFLLVTNGFVNGGNGSHNNGVSGWCDSGGAGYWFIATGGTSTDFNGANLGNVSAYADGKWHYWTIVMSPTGTSTTVNQALYVDGKFIGSSSNTSMGWNTNPMSVEMGGWGNVGGGVGWTMGDFGFWSRPLTVQEIGLLATGASPLAPNIQPITNSALTTIPVSSLVTNAGGTASASSTNGSEVAANAFDGNFTTFWTSSTSASMPQSVQYQLPSGVGGIPLYYGVAQRVDFSDGIPHAWQFQASNDGSSWTTLDTQPSITQAPNDQLIIYPTTGNLGVTQAYAYFRLLVTASSNVYVHIMELQVFGIKTTSPIVNATYNAPTLSLTATLNSPSEHYDYRKSVGTLNITSTLNTPTPKISITPSTLNITSATQAPSLTYSATVHPSTLLLSTALHIPTETYSGMVTPSTLHLSVQLHQPTAAPTVTVNPSTLTMTSTLHAPTLSYDYKKTVSPLALSATPIAPTLKYDYRKSLSPLNITSTLYAPNASAFTFPPNTVYNAVQIISFNPLVIVMNTNPAQIAIVDTTNPDTPTWTVYTYVGVMNPTAAAYNTTLNYIYVACADGKILEISYANPNTYSIINTGISANLTSIALLDTFFDTFAGTDYSGGEVIAMYEGSETSVATDIRFISLVNTSFPFYVNTTNAASVATDVRFNAIVSPTVVCDIRFLAENFVTLPATPIDRPSFRVYIGGIEVTDVVLESIEITHSADQKSSATFILARKHDQVDYMLDGTHRPVTGHPQVQITIAGNEEFGYNTPAYVWDIDCKSENEQVKITAFSELPQQDERSTVTLSIPGINEKLHIYHALINNPVIDNPFILPDDLNPPFYLGILIDTGYKTVQNVSRFQGLSAVGLTEAKKVNYVFGSGDSGITDFKGDFQYFKPLQNWTYFWFGHGTNFTTGQTWGGLFENGSSYLGTSPSSLTSSTWDVDFIDWWYQREFPDTIYRGDDNGGSATVYPSDFIGVLPIGYNLTAQEGAVGIGDPFGGNNTIDKVLRDHTPTTYSGAAIMAMRFALLRLHNPYAQNPSNPTPIAQDSIQEFDTRFVASEWTTKALDVIDSKFGITFGSPPYKKVSGKSGILQPAARWEDKPGGLYLYTPQGYNYSGFTRVLGEIEYIKLQNINGSVLPKTKCDIELFVDGYYHYNIALLKRINIDNTTTPNIYNGQNGFPVSVKSIHISAREMKVTLNCSNEWSRLELLELEGAIPDDSLYIIPESWNFITPKFDPNSLTETS